MRALQLATVGAFVECVNLERVMAAAHAATAGRSFSFWDSHCGTCSCKYEIDNKSRPGALPHWRMRRRAYTGILVRCKRLTSIAAPKDQNIKSSGSLHPMLLSTYGPMILPTTLCLAAAALLINFWLGMRIGKIRMSRKIEMGDGGDLALIARMRAQANFIENTPLFLILVGLIELAGKGGWWLPVAGALFMLGRVAHAFGMDGNFKPGRPIGTASAYLIQLGLAIFAVLIALGKF